MEILNYITSGCDALTASASPSVTALGLRMVLALATIMMVWFGVQEALSSTHHGHGFSMARFVSFFVLITFAYTMVKYYDTSVPGLGFSLQGFIRGGTNNLVDIIGNDTTTQMLSTIQDSLKKSGPGLAMLTAPYLLISYFFVQVILSILSALIAVIVAYGAVGATIVGILGPVFIPFLAVEKLEFLFWGWLRAFLGFSFYKVVAAATMSILGQLFMRYYANLADFTDPVRLIKNLPLLIILVIVNVFILIKIPAMTASIFSGSTSGHDGGTGMLTTAIAALG